MSDRVAVVTGGAGAIGAAIVHQLRESGVRTNVLDLEGTDAIACDMLQPCHIASRRSRFSRSSVASLGRSAR